jgi:hypothetical protein
VKPNYAIKSIAEQALRSNQTVVPQRLIAALGVTMLRVAIALLLVLGSPLAQANGGAPLLLVFNGMAFFYGSALIVIAEWLVYWRLGGIPARAAAWDSIVVNVYSTIVIGLGFPCLVAAVGATGGFIPGVDSDLFFAFGTWYFEGLSYPRLTLGFTLFWMLATYILTVWLEANILRSRWKRRHETPRGSPSALIWQANTLTYAALIAYSLYMLFFNWKLA